MFNALKMSFREFKVRKDPACPICGEHPTITHLIDYDEFCGVGRGDEGPALTTGEEITATQLKAKFDSGDPFTLVDVREPYEYAIGHIPGSKLVPLGTVKERLHEFDTSDEIVLAVQVRQAVVGGACKSSSRPGSRNCRTCKAAFWPGRTRLIRACLSIKNGTPARTMKGSNTPP